MYILLLWIAKLIQKLSRLFGNSGAAAPGLFIEKIWPRFLEKGLSGLSGGVVVISGTNGKTTTTKLVADTMHHFGNRVLTNTTGSNMTRGLISSIVSQSTWGGKLPFDTAILEVDEAYASVLAQRLPVRASLVLNVMRDQLDRFGEIDSTAKLLSDLTRATTECVVLNSNDPRVVGLDTSGGVSRVYFAVGQGLSKLLASDDDWHSKKPKTTKNFRVPMVDYELYSSSDTDLTININNKKLEIHSHFKGLHNHVNITAALALLQVLQPKVSPEEIIGALQLVRPAFGRGEEVQVNDATITLLLIKNPSSFMQTLTSTFLQDFNTTSIVINDAYADSRDVSWLWDIEVNKFKTAQKLYVSGTRGLDMAVRLKYDDLTTDEILSIPDLVDLLVKKQGSHAVFCTYTAMLALRKSLVKMGHLEQVI